MKKEEPAAGENTAPPTMPPPPVVQAKVIMKNDVDVIRDALRSAPYRDAVNALKLLDQAPIADVPVKPPGA